MQRAAGERPSVTGEFAPLKHDSYTCAWNFARTRAETQQRRRRYRGQGGAGLAPLAVYSQEPCIEPDVGLEIDEEARLMAAQTKKQSAPKRQKRKVRARITARKKSTVQRAALLKRLSAKRGRKRATAKRRAEKIGVTGEEW